MMPLSMRMVMVFIVAAAFLNFTNYTFLRFYNVPTPRKTGNKRHEISSSTPNRFTLASNSKLLCGANTSFNDPNCKGGHNTTPATTYSDMDDTEKPDKPEMDLCPEMPPGLGPVMEDCTTRRSLETFASVYSDIRPGGIYNMTTCVSRHSVAIIVPFRGLKSSLTSFLCVLHPFLMKQQLNYQIFVVEQICKEWNTLPASLFPVDYNLGVVKSRVNRYLLGQGNTSQPYNRGKLLNVGFIEARNRLQNWDCIVFHESYIVPLDSRNMYRCSWYPRQLAIRVERPYKSPYQPKIGGALAMTSEQFINVNGFSNMYWGNDADYDDLYIRLKAANYLIENAMRSIGKYRTLKNINTSARLASQVINTISPLYLLDGLTTLSYSCNIELRPFYTHIQVNIDEAGASSPDSKFWNGIFNQPDTTSRHIQTDSTSCFNVTTNGTTEDVYP